MPLEVSPPRVIGTGTYPPGATYGPRRMREFALIWLIEGDAEYRWGDAVAPAPAGSMVLCRPDATDFFRWDPSKPTRHGFMHFDVFAIPADWPPMAEWPFARMPGDGDILRPLFRHILDGQERGDPTQARYALGTLLAAFVTGETAVGRMPYEEVPPAVERALAHLARRLDDRPDQPISLAEMADAACVTPEHLCRVFKAATGRTPAETARLARLDRALMLVTRSNYSITEVAALCGFSGPSQFAQAFRQAFGQPPRAIRQAVQAGQTPPHPRLYRSTR